MLINNTLENAEKVVRSLVELEAGGWQEVDLSKLEAGKHKLLKTCVQLSLKRHLCVDILTPREGFDFDSAFQDSIEGMVNDIRVRIISYRDLVKHKELGSFHKDQDDVLLLQSVC